MIKVIITNNYKEAEAGTLTLSKGEITFDGPEKDMLEFMLKDEEFHWTDRNDETKAFSISEDPIDFITNLYRLLTGSRYTASEPEHIDTGISRAG